MGASYEMWTKVLQFWQKTSDPKESSKILKFLVCTKNKKAIKSMLTKEKNIFSNLQVKDHIKIFSLTVAKHVKKNKVLDYVLSNFKEVKPR